MIEAAGMYMAVVVSGQVQSCHCLICLLCRHRSRRFWKKWKTLFCLAALRITVEVTRGERRQGREVNL